MWHATVDPNRPSAARIYDYHLGGRHNFAVDRALAERAVTLVPALPRPARADRAFLDRAVRYAAGRGVRQFLDRAGLAAFLAGWDLVEPGLVAGPQWRPDRADDPVDDAVDDAVAHAILTAVAECR
jgi:hypothetical protein